jgi:hypothetical protein
MVKQTKILIAKSKLLMGRSHLKLVPQSAVDTKLFQSKVERNQYLDKRVQRKA